VYGCKFRAHKSGCRFCGLESQLTCALSVLPAVCERFLSLSLPRARARSLSLSLSLPPSGSWEAGVLTKVCGTVSNSLDARPVHLIITMIKWIRTSWLPIKNSLSVVPFRTKLNIRMWRSCCASSGSITHLIEREFCIDNLLVRIHFIIVMIWWTGLAPWKFEFPFPGSLTSTFLVNT